MNNKRRKKISDVINNVNKYKTDFEYIKSKFIGVEVQHKFSQR